MRHRVDSLARFAFSIPILEGEVVQVLGPPRSIGIGFGLGSFAILAFDPM